MPCMLAKAIKLAMMFPNPSRRQRTSVAWLVFSASEKISARVRPRDPRQEHRAPHPALPALAAAPAAPISPRAKFLGPGDSPCQDS